ncbi:MULTISPECIES: hypothetical protein [Halorussus]|nr:hypothetical protein [Halorussus vallis]USZ76090.1 hypothetical protein NGM07_01905 [Halorussus vallis]
MNDQGGKTGGMGTAIRRLEGVARPLAGALGLGVLIVSLVRRLEGRGNG